MAKFMKIIMANYSRYFNKKYGYSGCLFETTYKASMILSNRYLLHISRYIHLNPKSWEKYQYSSLVYFNKYKDPRWLNTHRILGLFTSIDDYMEFLKDHNGYKESLQILDSELADNLIL